MKYLTYAEKLLLRKESINKSDFEKAIKELGIENCYKEKIAFRKIKDLYLNNTMFREWFRELLLIAKEKYDIHLKEKGENALEELKVTRKDKLEQSKNVEIIEINTAKCCNGEEIALLERELIESRKLLNSLVVKEKELLEVIRYCNIRVR